MSCTSITGCCSFDDGGPLAIHDQIWGRRRGHRSAVLWILPELLEMGTTPDLAAVGDEDEEMTSCCRT
ncbi:hypothetical protein ACLOJK_027051 [Asimina triloba]